MTMKDQQDPKSLLNQMVVFGQHQLPGMDSGAYKLELTARVTDSKDNLQSEENIDNAYTFAVQGDRFRLSAPSNLIYGEFPSPDAAGVYSNTLPHVVFIKKSYPWSRFPTSKAPDMTPDPVSGADPDVPTWLAVLLLDEDDVAAFPSLALTPIPVTIGDLFPPAVHLPSKLGKGLSYFRKSKDTDDLEFGEKLTDSLLAIDIPPALFLQIVPSLEDLHYSAHVRTVSLVNKCTMAGISDQGTPNGSFSIVIGSRLPQTGKQSHAYLVNLEKMEDLLPGPDGEPPQNFPQEPGVNIRLAVLRHWTFASTGDSAAFTDTAMKLNGRDGKDEKEAEVTQLKLTYAGEHPAVKAAINLGYVPLKHLLRTGGKTVSWYRSPLSPCAVDEKRVQIPVTSPDKATIFDPVTGMLDVSYASAWTLGRLLALQDQSFSTALYQWKMGKTREVVNEAENEMLNEKFRPALSAAIKAQFAEIKTTNLHNMMFNLLSNNKDS